MTMPDMVFQDQSLNAGTDVSLNDIPSSPLRAGAEDKFPPPILEISKERMDQFLLWVDQYLQDCISDQQVLQNEWAMQEEAYRAKPGPRVDKPYVGASNETVPAIAMAVDPIHARLDTGIFKQDPVFQFKALKKSFLKYVPALGQWIDYYQKNKLKLRQVASPRLLEMTKLGTCVFKTVYDQQKAKIRTYDANWKVTEKEEIRFRGPKVFGISLGDILFPPLYQHLQDCPFVAERIRTTYWKLKVAEASGKVTNIDTIKGAEVNVRTDLEVAHEQATKHQSSRRFHDELEIFEIWCDYDIDGDDLPEHLVCTYHKDSRTILQLRYNWYFHQRKPYTIIPYSVTNDSLYGLGLCEMVKPFQDLLTKWHRMATDNAYLSNIRMFIVKRDSSIEEVPRLYAGRCFFVDNPSQDFIPFAASDIYPSTLMERQNVFGLIEKRTGVSDYLTGRESPILGSRATATSTVALIQEGTKRVEQVLENIRVGMAEIIENCIYIWIQYGLDGLDELVFGDDEIGTLVADFFETVKAENVNGSMAIDLSATDASGSRQVMQQMQLQVIQIMMQYLEKVLQAGAQVIQARAQMPEVAQQLAPMVADVLHAARNMFKDLLQKYDIRNPEDYLPGLEKYLNDPAATGQALSAGAQGGVGGTPSVEGIPFNPTSFRGPSIPMPAQPGSGGAAPPAIPMPGSVGSVPQGG